MRYPDFLKDNGKIGFIAPSFGCASEPYASCFDSALRYFEESGYKLVIGPNCRKSDGIGKSTNARDCGAEINEFFTSGKADVILSCGGGETMCEDLVFVDFEAISRSKPKWYMGYSDNSNLTFVLPTLCDTATVYGPCAPAFGMRPRHKALEDAFGFIKGEKKHFTNYSLWERKSLKSADNPLAPYNTTEPYSLRIPGKNKEITAEGRLLGGCMDCLSTLCGTPYDRASDFCVKYKEDGIIWFLESCELMPMAFRRALWQMDSCGWFKNVRAFLFGRPFMYGETMMGTDYYSSCVDILGKYNVPVVMDLDIGHLPPMIPMVTGAKAVISASEERNSFAIDYKI